jgi:hypothetical protein
MLINTKKTKARHVCNAIDRTKAILSLKMLKVIKMSFSIIN